MKINTIDVAKKMGIHPAQLLLRIAGMEKTLTFFDVWPEIDEAWVKTISAPLEYKHHKEIIENATIPTVVSSSPLSHDAIHVLDKLSRQGKWGSVSVTFEALQNIAHISKRDLEDVITELRKAALLDHDGSGRGTISLSSGKRKEIESIALHI